MDTDTSTDTLPLARFTLLEVNDGDVPLCLRLATSLAGKVVEINETIVEDPSIVNSDAEGEGWFFRIELEDTDSFDTLMDQDAYDEFLETL